MQARQLRATRAIAAVAALCGALACGGGEKPATGGSTSTSTPAAPAGSSGTAAARGAPAPVTGKTWDVKMYGDATGYRYVPESITIKRGDGVRWTVVSGPPHNVTFWADSIPTGAVPALTRNMTQTIGALAGPLLATANQTYSISFAAVPPGVYHYYCTPHLAMGMKGTITVQ